MSFAIADCWFESRRIDDDITLLWEPHVVPLLRCNIWHVRGRARDLLIDTGMGIASLRQAARDLLDKPVLAVATHSHLDHVGGHHEFADRLVHRLEAESLAEPGRLNDLSTADWPENEARMMREVGYDIPPALITAIPREGYKLSDYRRLPAPPTVIVEEGDIVDLGSRQFEVLHLPGHSPGSIGLWEAETGVLFSGDAIYDGPLLDELPRSDIPTYLRTMKRLRELPVSVVHAGHDPSFGRDRLREIADAYLRRRGTLAA